MEEKQEVSQGTVEGQPVPVEVPGFPVLLKLPEIPVNQEVPEQKKRGRPKKEDCVEIDRTGEILSKVDMCFVALLAIAKRLDNLESAKDAKKLF